MNQTPIKSPIFKSPLRAYKLGLIGIGLILLGGVINAHSPNHQGGIITATFIIVGLVLVIDAIIVWAKRKRA